MPLTNIGLANCDQMEILQTASFARAVKKLHKNEKTALDKALKMIVGNPECGDLKIGDLASVRVYKNKVKTQLYLLGYSIDEKMLALTLIALGSHENFYLDLKH